MRSFVCWLAPLVLAISAMGGCDDDESAADAGRDPLICDAIYVPFITFTFTDDGTGGPYCGPVTVSYATHGTNVSERVDCDCERGEVVTVQDGFVCHLNPLEGETSTITAQAAGYELFTQDVTLPYECHPRATVDVLLDPI